MIRPREAEGFGAGKLDGLADGAAKAAPAPPSEASSRKESESVLMAHEAIGFRSREAREAGLDSHVPGVVPIPTR